MIVVFLEGVNSPERFVAAAEEAAQAGKPIVRVKAGRSEVARWVVQAHTGSLMGSDRVVDAAFRCLGVMRLDTVDELLEGVELFISCLLPKGGGVGDLSLSGGRLARLRIWPGIWG